MASDPSTRRVVVTGIGAVTNLGADAASTWDAMKRGASGISRINGEPPFNEWDDSHWPVKIAGHIRGFDPSGVIDGREQKKLDRFAQLGLVAGVEAHVSSGLDLGSMDLARVGAIIGSGVGGITTIEQSVTTLNKRGPTRLSPFTVPKLMANAVAGNLSIRLGLRGPTSSHTTACASSGHSMGDAYETIKRGAADVIFAGGSEAAVTPLCLGSFMVMKALSSRNDEPTKASRPFDKSRDGFVLAEGAAVLVLEELEHAKARGATIHAELCGYACSTDASHITAPDPEGSGAMNAMRWAMASAGITPEQVDYINAHGTSTPLGDVAEINAVLTLFGDHARKSNGGHLRLSSTKSMTGHCLGASGAVEAVACLGALREGIIPPTINLENPDEAFDLHLVPNEAEEREVRYTLNNTFGFGGHNVSVVMGRYDG